jgi:protein ImuB
VRRKQLQPRPEGRALVLVRTVASRQVVVHACGLARSRGAAAGMTLAEARALCPGLTFEEDRPDRDRHALEALGRWMVRFSPTVAMEGVDAIALDVDGCQRLYGGLDRLAGLVSAGLRRLGLEHQWAIAPTLGAAWALASFGSGRIVEADQLEEALSPLPVAGLRLEAETVSAFHHLGIETIGQLMALPRAALPGRFGLGVLQRLGQALGRVEEPLVALAYRAPIEARLDFEGTVESLEVLWEAFKILIEQVLGQLRQRGYSARRLEAQFVRGDSSILRKTIDLSRPSRDRKVLLDLLRNAMEMMPVEEGVSGVGLSVPLFERSQCRQIGLLDYESQAAESELEHLVERLRVRMGANAVRGVKLVESHLPEKRCVLSPLAMPPQRGITAEASPAPLIQPRPLHLFPTPVEVRCMAAISEGQEGLPISFTCRNRTYPLSHVSGPERIAGPWWEGRNKTRDYFDVEDSSGRRFWLFRVGESRRWFLHGIFDC